MERDQQVNAPLYALPGDIFFTSSSSLLGRLIRWAETDPEESSVTWANHVGIVTTAGWLIPPNDGRDHTHAKVIESLWHTQHWHWYDNHKGENTRIAVFRPRGVSHANLRAILATAETFVGTRYGWWKLLFHLGDRIMFKGKKVLSHALHIDKHPICSYTIAKSYAAGWISFGMHPEAADPDEMMDHCQDSVDWVFVGQSGVGTCG